MLNLVPNVSSLFRFSECVEQKKIVFNKLNYMMSSIKIYQNYYHQVFLVLSTRVVDAVFPVLEKYQS